MFAHDGVVKKYELGFSRVPLRLSAGAGSTVAPLPIAPQA
jgi:hypothetical protein